MKTARSVPCYRLSPLSSPPRRAVDEKRKPIESVGRRPDSRRRYLGAENAGAVPTRKSPSISSRSRCWPRTPARTASRPLTYVFEVATDAAFTNMVFVAAKASRPATAAAPAPMLPDPLAPEHSYFWRVRAEDGANTGPYSTAASFDVFTPIVIDPPEPVSPGGQRARNTAASDVRRQRRHAFGPGRCGLRTCSSCRTARHS